MSATLSEAAQNARVADYHVALWTSVLLIAVLFAVVYFVRVYVVCTARACARARALCAWLRARLSYRAPFCAALLPVAHPLRPPPPNVPPAHRLIPHLPNAASLDA